MILECKINSIMSTYVHESRCIYLNIGEDMKNEMKGGFVEVVETAVKCVTKAIVTVS